MSLPFERRPFDAFLSHAHADAGLALSLNRFLTKTAGLNIWYDARAMAGGDAISSGLQDAIEQSRGLLLLASPQSLSSGWVKREVNIAIDESTRNPNFRVVILRLGNADAGSLVRGLSWIDMPSSTLTEETAIQILQAFHPSAQPVLSKSRDVYVSASWHVGDNASAQAVCKRAAATGVRLIGDRKEQKGFQTDSQGKNSNRVPCMIRSCGGFVGIVPYRGIEHASLQEKPYKYFLQEMDWANEFGLPSLVVADPRVRRTDGDDSAWFRLDTASTALTPEIDRELDGLWERCISPPKSHYIFFATDLADGASDLRSPLRSLIEQITGMPTIVGNEIHEASVADAIIRCIQDAFIVLADLSGDSPKSFNLNVCMEAAIARAVCANLEIFASGEPRRPPFMIRGPQMPVYGDAVERAGLLHRILLPYQRRILNQEL